MENEVLEEKHDMGIEIKKVSPLKTSFKWGLISGIVFIIINLLSYLLKDIFFDSGIMDIIISVSIIIVFIILAQIAHKNIDLGGKMSYGRSLGIGTLVSLLTGLILAIWVAILYNIVMTPEELEKGIQFSLERQVEMMENFGAEMTDEMIEAQEKGIRKGFGPISSLINITIVVTLFGFIFSLITGIFTKQN